MQRRLAIIGAHSNSLTGHLPLASIEGAQTPCRDRNRHGETPPEITIMEKAKILGTIARGMVAKLARTG
jgi:hypothetical protein